jgi:hypothetical protein
MKFINITKVLLLSTILVFGGCKLKNPTDDVKIKIDTDKLLPYTFSVQFIDQATESAITSSEVKIEISGKDANKIYELSGSKTFKVVNGMINLAIKTSSTPSDANPLQFQITATADGYLATSADLNYSDAESRSFDIPMVALNNLPPSITKTTASVSNDNNGLASDLTITSAKVSTINTGMSVTIPAGTKFLDASGNVLVGNFEAKVYYFSPETEALQFIPKGDENGDISVKYKNNQTAKYLSIDAACAYIEITTQNYFVASFSKPISVSMDVHKEIVNIETGNDVKSGDSLEFISHPINGTDWYFQKNSKVEDLGGSTFKATGQTSNAYWVKASFGGKGRSLGKASTACYVKYKFVQTSSTCPSTFRLQNLVWRRSNGSIILGWTGPFITQNQVISANGLSYMFNISTLIKNLYNPIIRATPYNIRTNTILAAIQTPTATTCYPIGGIFATAPALNYALPAGQNCNPILLTISINCPNLSVTSIPPIYKKVAGTPATTPWTTLVYVPRGSQFPGQYYVHGLTVGTTYTFKTTYKGQLYTQDVLASSSNMSYSVNVTAADCP